MDITFIKKEEVCGICYKLFRATFFHNYYVIIAQTKKDFFCGSFSASKDNANQLFSEIAQSATDPFTIGDILSDYAKQNS